MSGKKVIRARNAGKPKKRQAAYDLERLKWLDPCSTTKFEKSEIIVRDDAASEAVLQNIVKMIGEIFEDLSVFEQFSETTSRGAEADPKKKIDFPDIRRSLAKTEEGLWKIYSRLQKERKAFINRQLAPLEIDAQSVGLKVNIGCGAHPLPGWLNLDAGGGDIAMNVTWGLPLRDESADFAYSAHLLEHLRYSDQAPVFVREVYRILAKGGTVRFVVPDIKKLLTAYVEMDRRFFTVRANFYPLSEGFIDNGIATLDYILLFAGAGPQLLNYNHKFGYDATTLGRLLTEAGFTEVRESSFMGSSHPELMVDDSGQNALTKISDDRHYSLFMEATK